jgi:zinc/manganese transport system substrate-binding protein
MRQILSIGIVMMLGFGLGACGSDDGGSGSTEDRPSVVVTTNILGDVVASVVGGLADVEVIMPLGADPHDFAPSARQAASMENADLLVINGAGFEAGLDGVIDSVAGTGTAVYSFADHVTLIEGDRDEHADETHADEGGLDPHFWTDPTRVASGVAALADVLAEVDGIDAAVLREQAGEYVEALEALDAEIETIFAAVPEVRRVLVTNHEVFGYFADRYGFRVVGAVVPSLTTNAETSSRELEELAGLITDEGIGAIFAETTQSTELAEALADEVGGEVQVVELYSESLGEEGSGAETYIDLVRTNARLIAEALGVA